MKKILAFFLVLFLMTFLSCVTDKKDNDYKNEKMLAERIQYDVLIKTPNPDLDWWTQNIEGSKREAFVKTILDLAYTGKVKAYDYFNKPLTPEEVKAIDNSTDTITMPDINDPSKTYDTVIKSELDIQKITKVRFLEEWYLDEKKYSFDKKVCGIMLLKENYSDSMELRGYTPLFWLYLDDEYPAKMK
ncbi:MAG: hypothetical protein V1904_09630 [Bacteroidota bacterium]